MPSDRVVTGGGVEYLVTQTENIPPALHDDNWLVVMLSPHSREDDKSPVATGHPGSRWADYDSLLTLEEAVNEAEKAIQRRDIDPSKGERAVLARQFTEDSPFFGVDLDDVVLEDGTISEEVRTDIVSCLGSYTEFSQSGKGLHVIGRCSPESASILDAGEAVDLDLGSLDTITTSGRYFCYTGEVLKGFESVTAVGEVMERVLFRSIEEGPSREAQSTTDTEQPKRDRRPDNTEEDATVKKVKLNGFASSDGDFERLWKGDQLHYDTPSEADMALVCKLVFWCRGDRGLIDQCFRQSARYGCRPNRDKPKWDRDGYRDLTIENGCDFNTEQRDEDLLSPTDPRLGEYQETVCPLLKDGDG